MKTYIVINHYILSDEIAKLAIQAVKSFRDTHDCFIVGVDDCSPLKNEELIGLHDKWIKLDENKGFAGSANVGFQWILDNEKDDCYIVYANNDIKVYPGWFQEFTKHNFDMIGGLGYMGVGIQHDRVNSISEGGQYDDWMFPGGFYMTTKNFFEEIGLYDENYKHGGVEDIDLFYRAKKTGKKLIMTPNVSYWHKEGATRYSETQKDKQAISILENQKYFENKWGFHPIKELFRNILKDNRINF